MLKRIIRKIRKMLAKKVQKNYVRVSNVETLAIELSSICNLKCVYCAMQKEKFPRSPVSFMDKELIYRLIQSLGKEHLRKVDFIGFGEVTVHPDWWEIVARLRGMGIGVGLFSNLAKDMSDREIEALASLTNLSTSFDCADQQILSSTRCTLQVEQFRRNVERICSCALAKDRSPFVEVTAVVSNINVLKLRELREFFAPFAGIISKIVFRSLQYQEVLAEKSFVLCTTEGMQMLRISDQNELAFSASLAVLGELPAYFKEAGLCAEFDNNLMNEIHAMRQKEDPEHKKNTGNGIARAERKFCCQPWSHPYIKITGEMFPCCATQIYAPLGNIASTDIKLLLNEPTMQQMRRGFLTGELPDVCKNCNEKVAMPSLEAFQEHIYMYCEDV